MRALAAKGKIETCEASLLHLEIDLSTTVVNKLLIRWLIRSVEHASSSRSA
jgi:hypothetical protein